MTYSSYPFDGQSTSESQYRKLFRQIQQNGVITPASTAAGLKVTAGGGMSVNMAAGDAIVEGFFFTSDDVVNLTVQAASSINRTDQLILRLDLDANNITPMILRGNTSSGFPSALNQSATGTLFDLLIATITVPANGTSIAAANIFDSRSYASNPVGVWTTSTRPTSPRLGQSGFNLDVGAVEAYVNGSWVNVTVSDTGWQNLVLAVGTGTAKYRRIGSVVEVVIAVTGVNIPSSNAGQTIVAANTIPAAATPADTTYGVANFGGQASGLAVVNTNGSVAGLNNTGSAATTFRCSFTYFVG